MKYLLEKDKKRRKLFCKHEKKRILIKALIRNENLSRSARWKLSLKLASLPKNSTISRIRNRCVITGRPRSVHNYFKVSRVLLRELISNGHTPGMTKYSR